jgi:hypothetical protein
LPGGGYALEAAHFAQPVLGVALDGQDRGVIAISPWRAELGALAAGTHRLDITAFGNRMNTFGALHNCDYAARMCGPDAWRCKDHTWTYEYRLRENGVLAAARLVEKTERQA